MKGEYMKSAYIFIACLWFLLITLLCCIGDTDEYNNNATELNSSNYIEYSTADVYCTDVEESAAETTEIITTQVAATQAAATKVETTQAETTQPYAKYYTENDIIMVAKTIYGEAGSYHISREDKAKVAWTICNRVDDSRWPNSISAVITQPCQFYGYSANHPVTNECYEIAEDVLTRWSLEKQGVDVYREASRYITAFYGDGQYNYFYEY